MRLQMYPYSGHTRQATEPFIIDALNNDCYLINK